MFAPQEQFAFALTALMMIILFAGMFRRDFTVITMSVVVLGVIYWYLMFKK